jgi:putative phosphoribosyl transferase
VRLFKNQRQAAEELAEKLLFLREEDPIILGLANGGVLIADAVASVMGAQADVLLTARLYAPQSPDHVVGAVDEHGHISMIQSTARWHHLTSQQMIEPARKVFRKLQRRRDQLRAVLPEVDVRNRTVILCCQGIATGAKMLGAIASVRDRGARRIIATAPAGHGQGIWALHDAADQVVIPHQPSAFKGVDRFYEEFIEVTDDLVLGYAREWAARREQSAAVTTITMKLTSTKGWPLACEVDLPPGTTRGSGPYPAVVFAHGNDSDGRSPRSVPISRRLAQRGIVGVRPDFTAHGRSGGTPEDATPRQMLEDLHTAFDAAVQLHEVDGDRMGLNGAGAGAMLALLYAAQQPLVKAMVIRGPICGEEVEAARTIVAPTLVIHGEYDSITGGPGKPLEETVKALDERLAARHEVLRIAHSNHLFSDPISRELMVSATVDWMVDQLPGPAAKAEPAGKAPAIDGQRSEAAPMP